MRESVLIRDAIFERLKMVEGFKDLRRSPLTQLTKAKLPALCVYHRGTRARAEARNNLGEPKFDLDVTITVSTVRAASTPKFAEGFVDHDFELAEFILTDPSLNRRASDSLFDGVTAIEATPVYIQEAEAFFVECRIDMTFLVGVSYDPRVTDAYKGVTLTVRPLGHPNSPAITVKLDQEDA